MSGGHCCIKIIQGLQFELNSSTSVNSQGIEIYDLFQDVIFKIENNLFHNTKRVGEKEKTMLEINNSPGCPSSYNPTVK